MRYIIFKTAVIAAGEAAQVGLLGNFVPCLLDLRRLETVSVSRQDFSLESLLQKKKAEKEKGNIWRNKTLQPPSHQQVCGFVCRVQIEVVAFEVCLQISI